MPAVQGGGNLDAVILPIRRAVRDRGAIIVDASEQPDKADRTGMDWSAAEVERIVSDYFDMLRTELHRQPYNKSEHRRKLLPLLDQRSKGSVEYKHENVSGVLVGMGLPYIAGYKPACNFQMMLGDEVAALLDTRPHLLDQMRQSPLSCPRKLPDLRRPPASSRPTSGRS